MLSLYLFRIFAILLSFHHLKTLHAHYKKLSIEFEKRLKTTVLLIVTRTIQSRWIKVSYILNNRLENHKKGQTIEL
jgi:hypothetical protein